MKAPQIAVVLLVGFAFLLIVVVALIAPGDRLSALSGRNRNYSPAELGTSREDKVDKECEETWEFAKARAAREQDPDRRRQMEEIIARVPEFRAGCRR